MTTVKTMLRTGFSLRAPAMLACALLLLLAGTPGCQSKPELVAPELLISPYDLTETEALWAVAPLANESGTTAVDVLAVSDAIVGKLTETEGIAALPMNRTLAAMRALQLPGVRSPAEARALAEALGVDAIIVGSITAYDPYNPPTIGLTLALYTRSAPPSNAPEEDPRSFRSAATETAPPRSTFTDAPSSVVIEQLPGNNHAVKMNVRQYAEGRHKQGSALGWEEYLASMDRYTDFAAYWVVRRLLEEERLRLARAPRDQIGLSR
jgi:hypothetical protein